MMTTTRQRERTRQSRKRRRAERPRVTRFQSETSDREYTITHRRQPEPVATCNCPGYLSHGHCWHQKEVLGKDYAMTTTAITPYRVQPPAALLPTKDDLAMIKAIAATAGAEKSLLPRVGDKTMTEGQAAVIMLYGRELGVQPMAALQQIYVINGRPQASAQLMTGLMQSADPNAGIEILERTTERAKVRITYKGRRQTFETSMEDAQRANLTRNQTWTKYPKQMLVWTAVRTGVRLMAPDALNALAQLPSAADAAALFPADDAEVIEAEAVEVTDVTEPTLTDESEADITPDVTEPPTANDIGSLRGQAWKAYEDYDEEHGTEVALALVETINADAVVNGNLALSALTADQCKELIDKADAAPSDEGAKQPAHASIGEERPE